MNDIPPSSHSFSLKFVRPRTRCGFTGEFSMFMLIAGSNGNSARTQKKGDIIYKS